MAELPASRKVESHLRKAIHAGRLRPRQRIIEEDLARELALQGSKAEAVGSVALEDKLIEAIAESTDTVIEDDWIGKSVVHPSSVTRFDTAQCHWL